MPPSIGQGVLRQHGEKESLGPLLASASGGRNRGWPESQCRKGGTHWRGGWAVDMAGGKKTVLAGYLSPW